MCDGLAASAHGACHVGLECRLIEALVGQRRIIRRRRLPCAAAAALASVVGLCVLHGLALGPVLRPRSLGRRRGTLGTLAARLDDRHLVGRSGRRRRHLRPLRLGQRRRRVQRAPERHPSLRRCSCSGRSGSGRPQRSTREQRMCSHRSKLQCSKKKRDECCCPGQTRGRSTENPLCAAPLLEEEKKKKSKQASKHATDSLVGSI